MKRSVLFLTVAVGCAATLGAAIAAAGSPGELRSPERVDTGDRTRPLGLAVAKAAPIPAGDKAWIERLRQRIDPAVERNALRRLHAQAEIRFFPYDFAEPLGWRNDYARQHAEMTKTRALAAWTQEGPVGIAGRMSDIVAKPGSNGQVLYASAAGGGVWKSANGGTTWVSLTDHLPSLSGGRLLVDPTYPNDLYFGTGEPTEGGGVRPGAGIFYTNDEFQTYTLLGGVQLAENTEGLAISADGMTVFAATNRGLFAYSWYEQQWFSLLTGWFNDVVTDPTNSGLVYVSSGIASQGGVSGVFRSTDGGVNWQQLLNVGEQTYGLYLAIDPSQPSNLYAIYSLADGALDGVLATADYGDNWFQLTNVPNFCGSQCWWYPDFIVDPGDSNVLYAAGLDIYRSLDRGQSWQKVSNWLASQPQDYVHADHHVLYATGPGMVWSGNDDGVAYSADYGATWTVKNSGIVASQFWGFDFPPDSDDFVVGGFQDNGTQRLGPDGAVEIKDGDGGFCAVDQEDPLTVFAEYVYLTLSKSTNGGRTFFAATNGIPFDQNRTADGGAAFIAPFIMDPNNSKRMLAGTWRAWYTEDGADSWYPVSEALVWTERGTITTLDFSPADANVAWSGSSDGLVAVLSGGQWQNATANLPERAITRVLAHPTDANRAWVTVSGFGTGHVFATANRGASWSDVSGNLGDVPANDIAVDHQNPNTVWVATDYGVYRSDAGGGSWTAAGTGLPAVACQQLRYSPKNGILRVGTHGRGVWTLGAKPDLAGTWHTTNLAVVANQGGQAGTHFVTDARVLNASDRQVSVNAYFTPGGDDGSDNLPRSFTVAPWETKELNDVVANLFGAQNTGGAVQFIATDGIRPVVSSRTYNDASATGTYGQYIGGVESSESIGAGEGKLHILQLAKFGSPGVSGFRSNIGFSEVSGAAVTVKATLFNAAGARVGEPITKQVPPYSWVQFNAFPAGTPDVASGRAEIEVISGSGRVLAYASVVDNLSSDQVYVPAVRPAPLSSFATLIPAVVRSPGQAGSFWVTDVRIFNPSTTAKRVTLAYLEANRDNADPQGPSRTIQPGELVSYDDVMSSLFGASQGFGALSVLYQGDSSGELVVTSRTYNRTTSGTYGQFIAGVPVGENRNTPPQQHCLQLARSGSPGASGSRTNLGLVNIQLDPSSLSRTLVRYSLIGSNGNLLHSGTKEVPVNSVVQFDPFPAWLTGTNIRCLIEAENAPGFGPLYAYASVVDNRSNDPIYIPAVVQP